MTIEKIREITKWVILASHLIALFAILIGAASPLLSPTGRRNNAWMELGFELLKYVIPATVIYTIIQMI